jgi:hypothetical protein
MNETTNDASKLYISEYRNYGSLTDAPATPDFKKYMATSLIKRGLLFQNSKRIEELYRASLNELFSDQFKNLFLYALDRDITDIYTDVMNIKNMGPIGVHDYFSSILGVIPAKFLPVFESFEYNIEEDYTSDISISENEKRSIILSRENKEEGIVYKYRKLSSFDKIVGPSLTETYFVNPKIPDSVGYVKVSDTRELPNPDIDYYEKINGEFIKTTNFDIVEDYSPISNEEKLQNVALDKTYYEKIKNPNSISYVRVTEDEPDESTQYYVKDPTNPNNFIITDLFNKKKDYVSVENTDSKYPNGLQDYYILVNNVYKKCTDSDFNPKYSYSPVPSGETYDNIPEKYYVKESDNTYRNIDVEADLISVPIQESTNVEEYIELIDKSEGPKADKEYFIKNANGEYIKLVTDNFSSENQYGATTDDAYDENKTYYVEESGSYREAMDSDYTLTPVTVETTNDVYNPTPDISYDKNKTYYVEDSNTGSYREAIDSDYTLTPVTTEETNEVYNPTTDDNYNETKTYYVEESGSYREAIDDDFNMESDSRAFIEGTTYYEKTTETQNVPTGENTRSFKHDVTYYEKTTERQNVPTGENTRSFKPDVTYYEITGTTKVFDSNITYYIKHITEVTSIVDHSYLFDPDIVYYTRDEDYDRIFKPGITYYTLEVVGNLFVPNVVYYTKNVIDNGYRYEVTTNFNVSDRYIPIDKTLMPRPNPDDEYYILNDDVYSIITNLQTWDPDTEYYVKSNNYTFKDTIIYYIKKIVTKFKRHSDADPRYEYYTSIVLENGYDKTKYEKVIVTDEFEDRDYYIGEIDFENTPLTTAEKENIIKLNITKKVNEKFDFYLRDMLSTAKQLFTSCKLSDITKMTNMESHDCEIYNIRVLYNKFINVIYTLAYSINMANYLDDTCDAIKLINDTTSNLLSKVHLVGEMLPIKHYFTKKVINTLIPDVKKEELHYHYGYVSPFIESVTPDDNIVTIDEMTMKLTENMINLRSIFEHTDIATETNTELLYGIFAMVFNMIIQLFLNSAYLSKNKSPVIQSVSELFKKLNPTYDGIVTGESLKNFIKLTE